MQTVPSLTFTMAMTALITPFKNGEIDFESFEKLLDNQEHAGIRDLLVLGSTGEALALTEDEKMALLSKSCQRIAQRIWMGVLEPCTQKALEQIRAARRWRLEGLVLLAPYYLKPTQQDMRVHFQKLLDESPWPCIIYNNPSRCGVSLAENTLIELSSHPHFLGIKECDNSPGRIHRLAQRLGSHQWLLCGDDIHLPSALLAGARGIICSSSNAIPQLLMRLLSDFEKGKFASFRAHVQQWLEIVNCLEPLGNPRAVKALLSLSNDISSELRAPLIGASNDQLDALKKQLEQHRELFQPLSSLTPC